MKFSPRLKAIFSECVPGVPLVDLCCDHGYLGIHAYLSKKFPEILFVDQAPLALPSLEEKFKIFGPDPLNETRVQFSTSDAGALTTVLRGTVVIAGIGGVNMMDILSRLFKNGYLKADTLVLAPHRHRELYEVKELFGYQWVKTLEVTEANFVRPIFVFKN